MATSTVLSSSEQHLRIACLTRITLAHKVKGGMEQHLRVLAEGLTDLGHEVEVYTTASPTGEANITLNGIPYHFLASPAGRYRPAWTRESQKVAKQMGHDHTVDVLWGQGAGAEAASRLSRRSRPPLVTVLHGTFLGEFRTNIRNLSGVRSAALALLMIWRFAAWRGHIKNADHLVVLTHSEEHSLRRWFRDLPPMTVIPNGIDVSLFAPDPIAGSHIREQLSIPRSTPLLIAVGRLVHEKGTHLAIAALQGLKNRNAHLVIVGDGSDREALRNMSQTLGVSQRVRFMGMWTEPNFRPITAPPMPSLCLLSATKAFRSH